MRTGLVLAACLVAGALRLGAEDSAAVVLERATHELSQFSFRSATPLFRKALERAAPASEERQRSAYGLAVCLQNDTPCSAEAIAEAVELFRGVAGQGGHSPLAARATLNLGRIAELSDYYGDPIDLAEAERRYREVVAGWPDDDIADEASLRLASALLQRGDARAAATSLEAWLQKRPNNAFASPMRQWLGDTYLLFLDDPKQAVASYIAADDLGLQWPGHEGIVYWRIARLAEERLHDRDLAIKYYTRLCEKAQTSGKAFEAQCALARLGAPVPELGAFASYRGQRPPLPAAQPQEHP